MAYPSIAEIQPIVARIDARAAGATHYFTGKPCKKGHVAPRFACNSACAVCEKQRVGSNQEYHRAKNRAWRIANPERFRAGVKAWTDANPDRRKAISNNWYAANRERHLATGKAWIEANPGRRQALGKARYDADPKQHNAATQAWYAANRARHRDICRAWEAANPERARAIQKLHNAHRRAMKKQQTPLWADRATIKAFYLACPPGYHVDHIVPIRGKNVSGLHVHHNLQYLSPSENHRKGNYHE